MQTATARLSSTIGDGDVCASRRRATTTAFQSVSSGRKARAWQAAMAACSV